MKNRNLFRDLSAEKLVLESSGPLHANIPEGVKPVKRSGPKPYEDADDAQICLKCPNKVCQLDLGFKFCRRYEGERRKKEYDKTGD